MILQPLIKLKLKYYAAFSGSYFCSIAPRQGKSIWIMINFECTFVMISNYATTRKLENFRPVCDSIPKWIHIVFSNTNFTNSILLSLMWVISLTNIFVHVVASLKLGHLFDTEIYRFADSKSKATAKKYDCVYWRVSHGQLNWET